MDAVVLTKGETSSSAHVIRVPIPQLKDGEVLIKLHAAALNHRDLWIMKNLYPGITDGSILGADGTGQIVAVGMGDKGLIGERVVINPSVRFDSEHPTILGMLPCPGTFAEYIAVDRRQVYPCPPHLTPHQAASLPLAGLTAYRAVVTKGEVKAGSRVLITGIGGGVALAALQFAVALGAEVYVTSGSEDKIARAVKLGAKQGFNYRKEAWTKELRTLPGGVDVVIDGTGGEALNGMIRYINRNGKIVVYGATLGPCEKLDLARLFLKHIELRGTSMGGDLEFQGMLEMVNALKIEPIVSQVFPLNEFSHATDHLRRATQFGKVVLDCQSL